MRALTFLASRFVAGDDAAEALEAVRGLEKRGLKASLDFLGEETTRREHADAAAGEYLRLLEGIHQAGLKGCNISLKLTQIGLNIDPNLARKNLLKVVKKAAEFGNFVRLDMEGSPYTQSTLDLFYAALRESKNVGAVIQSSLKRSQQDIAELNKAGARVRLCKGAYQESADIAFQDKAEVNESFDALARDLLENGQYPALATHDEERIAAVIAAAKEREIGPDRFEFQMLYGLRPKRWGELAAAGYNVRIYVPYGTHWLPYFVRRIRERKENWLFVLKNLFKG